MLYLLDANVLIDANRDYYPIERVPEFWQWLLHHARSGRVKIPAEIHDEVKRGNDDLAQWVKEREIKDALVLDAEAHPADVRRAIRRGYAPNLTDTEIDKLGRDPFLIAYALRDARNHCIVTTEISKPSKKRANRHLPDAADRLGIETYNTFELTRRLDFRTQWRSSTEDR